MPQDSSLERLILAIVQRADYRPLKPRELARQLEMPEDQLRQLKKAIKRLAKAGHLAWGPQHLVLKSAPRGNAGDVIGRFRRATGGFGFVTPLATQDDRAGEDVFIPERKTLDASSGDLVRVHTSRQRRGNQMRTSGRIVEVIQRRSHRFVGTYLQRGRWGVVHVDADAFPTQILVGDAAAKNCRAGDKVVIEMVRFPSHRHEGEGVIVEVLGDRGRPGIDTLTIIRQFDLPDAFPEAVLDGARAEADKFNESIAGDRRDFSDWTVITIDPKEARDFDDAISLEALDNGHWLLGVHIADVSHFVRPNTALDNEAYRRGTSVYLPDRVLPMLPEVVSNNLASLQPERVRYTLSVLLEMTADGVPVNTDWCRAAIRSDHRFNYEEIDQYLADDRPWKRRLGAKVFRLLRDMHTLAMRLRKRRLDRGAFNLVIPEIQIDLDEDGKVCGAHTRQHTESHQIIEEFMLAANEAVARRLQDLQLPFLRRIHEPPSAARLKDLKIFLVDLGIECGDLESRFEINRVIDRVAGRPESDAIHFSILRAMQKAVYGPRELGHFALASNAYCHFTSPIRRYPDLIIHRMVGALIDGQRPAAEFGQLARLGQHCSDTEQRAEAAERELIKLKLLNYLADQVGQEMDVLVTGVEAFGLFAQGIELPAEGFVPLESLPRDRYQYDRSTRTLAGLRGNAFRLGDPLKMRIARVDPDRRELEFEFVSRRPIKSQATDKPARTPRRRRGAAAPAGKDPAGRSKRARATGARKRGHKTAAARPRKHK